MKTFFSFLFSSLQTFLASRASLQLEIVALRHQLNVLQRSQRGRIQLNRSDRLLWVWLSTVWSSWRSALVIVKPDTVLGWHRKGFRLYWTWKSRGCRPGRPELSVAVRSLIRKMRLANPTGGAPRIHGELLMLGFEVSETSVAKYMGMHRKPPSQTWRTFLKNHAQQLVSADFFIVPTLNFRLLYVFVVLEHHRRRVVHFNITANPTAEWAAQQMREAFPFDTAPRFLIRDRDKCYGKIFRETVQSMDIAEVLTAPHSPWQNGYVERLIGSIRRECLDHFLVLNETSLRKILRSYFQYYERARTHLALEKNAPQPREVFKPERGRVVEFPEVGELHHRYERRAA
ncbi:MAG: transposase [Acidobacteria bacterium]|nr:transposase [Acidobacteriota bacterium]